MKKILIAFFICALYFSVAQGQKITALTVATSADDNSLMMTRTGSTGNVIKRITIANLFKNRTFIGTTIFPSTTTIAGNTVPGIVRDTMTARIAAATPINDLAPIWADTLTWIGTKKNIENFAGGGSGINRSYLQFIIGTTIGAPANGDTSLVHTSLAGKEISVYRGTGGDLYKQYFNSGTANIRTGYCVYNNATGEIRFRPALATGNRVFIIAEEPINVTWLYPSGAGGASVLLDSLLAVYEMDEVSGTSVIDAYGANDGVTNATPDAVGKIGKSKIFGGTSYITIPNNASLIPLGDKFSFSCWFYITTLPSVADSYEYFLRLRHVQAPTYGVTIFMSKTNYIAFYVTNTAGTTYEYETAASAVAAGQWYHLVCVNEGDGKDGKIYLNKTDITSYHPTAFTGTLLQYNSTVTIGNHTADYTVGFRGYIDQSILYKQALTPADVSWLWNDGNGRAYPFN